MVLRPKQTGFENVKDNVQLVWYLTLILAFPCYFIYILIPDSFKYPIVYSVEYGIEASHVHYDKKPVDCDWGHAPMGDKDCHFKDQLFWVSNPDGKPTDVYVSWVRTPN